MKNLIIYGAGSHAELVYAYFSKDSDYRVLAFTVEKEYVNASSLFGLSIIPFEEIESVIPPTEAEMFIAIGPFRQNAILENICERARAKGYTLASYFPSKRYRFFDTPYGFNCFIDHGSQFHPYVTLGDGVTVIGSQLGHHASIGSYTFISTAIVGGNVVVEDHVFIGMGAIIKQGVRIGKGSFIGMGCVIAHNVAPYSVLSVRTTKRREGLDARKLRSF